MTTTTAPHLLTTPFHDFHIQHHAKLVDFTGWEMPLHYGSIIDEHHQVRRSGGIFDVSHMGRLRFTGRDAERFLDRICTRQINGMKDGQARYSIICNERGGCRDDVLVYKLGDGEFIMVCNAANRMKLHDHFAQVKTDEVFKLVDETEKSGMIALQGPKIMDLLSKVSSEVPNLKRYWFTQKNILIAKILISRTGYTGEDGVEVIIPRMFAAKAVDMLLKHVDMDDADAVVRPAGLGARDSLRLESCMALYGHEITEDLDPVSAGLNFAIKLDKGEDGSGVPRFIGQDALQKIAAEGPRRPLAGLVLDSRRAARQDMPIRKGDTEIGFVTSGCNSPTLGKSIAMGYVDAAHSNVGSIVQIDLGRQMVDAQIVPMPFYKAG